MIKIIILIIVIFVEFLALGCVTPKGKKLDIKTKILKNKKWWNLCLTIKPDLVE